MKILLLEIIDPAAQAVETRYPPVGLAYLAGYGRARRPEWEYVIGRTNSEIDEALGQFGISLYEGYDIIGLTFVTQNAERAVECVEEIRKKHPRVPIVAGGHHVTAFPWWLEERTGAGVVTIEGEGERAFFDYCEAMDTKDYGCIPDIPGVCFAEKSTGLYQMNANILTPRLDKLPMPAIDLLSPGDQGIQIFTSRGCPYECVFCSSTAFWGGVRYHSPERVVAEIKRIRDMGMQNINIYDDLFAVGKKRLRKIVKLLKRAGQTGLGGYTCLGRANAMDEEVADLLAEMGVQAVAFGLESGSDRVLKQIKGGSASVDQNHKAVDYVRRAGMRPVGSVVYGLPGETEEDVLATLEMVERMPLMAGEAYLATPYPGTPLWEDACDRGLVGDDMDFSRLRFDWGDDAVIVGDFDLQRLTELRILFTEVFKK